METDERIAHSVQTVGDIRERLFRLGELVAIPPTLPAHVVCVITLYTNVVAAITEASWAAGPLAIYSASVAKD